MGFSSKYTWNVIETIETCSSISTFGTNSDNWLLITYAGRMVQELHVNRGQKNHHCSGNKEKLTMKILVRFKLIGVLTEWNLPGL